ncbi:tectonin beta-propeller repeat containing [Chamberlinius hualienensis]
MPPTTLWAVTNQGKVFVLSTNEERWKELPYCGMEFKRVSSTTWCSWGIGGDHQVYVYVISPEVPIRYKEVAYENHRWNPKEGFCSRLLPTDRSPWSSKDGLVSRLPDKIRLPTLSWKWEGDWRIEQTFDGQSADPEGWMYAIDFPAPNYTKEKSWLSYVRRRKWTRFRCYMATNTWANIPCIHDDPIKEPFIDVTIGGQDVPGGDGDTLIVWTVTVLGRIMFRKGVNRVCPEGDEWIHILTPNGGEVNQLSVGPTGLLWAVTWNGYALVRLGVTRTELSGSGWANVDPPNENSKLLQISVGCNSVWAISRDNKVWFRKGVNGRESGTREELATGTGWVEMVGDLSLISVGLGDQVWALSADERKSVYIRTGVTPLELSGKTWKPITAALDKLSSEHLETERKSSIQDTGYYYEDSISDISWAWISGSGCLVDAQYLPEWFGGGGLCRQSQCEPWRKVISKLLTERHDREVIAFLNYEQAIDKTSWMTSGKGQALTEKGHQNQWVDCVVELEKIGTDQSVETSLLRLHFHNSDMEWHKEVINLLSVTCSMGASDRNKLVLAIYTSNVVKEPLRLSFPCETELEDWMSLLSTTSCELRGIYGRPSEKSVWALTRRGDIFVHDFSIDGQPFWRQVGGHLRIIETCSAEITWGLGYNHSIWVYTGGWGGGFFNGMDSSCTYPMTDVRNMYIYENQRWNPLTGFSYRRLPTDRYAWSDRTGILECTKENTKLPSMHWQWTTEWLIDFNTPGGVDQEGWQYAKDFPMAYHGHKGLTDYVRRRRWVRKCKLTTTGPWEELNSVPLLDISFQTDYNEKLDPCIRLWAVSIKGEVLCRVGCTRSCPQGISWEHIAHDEPAQSLSVGGRTNGIWVITKNGGALLRHGISEKNPVGTVWFTVTPPETLNPLRCISAGPSTVWAVDAVGNLWFRQEIMPIFPEGTSWKLVCGNMRKISVGCDDQAWGIAESFDGFTNGVLCRRIGITEENKLGTDWEYNVGSGWHHVSARGSTVS